MKLHGYKQLKDSQQAKAGEPPITITLDIVTTVLHDILADEVGDRISVEGIQKKVADHYRLPITEMTSKKRTASVAFARQVAMYLCGQLTSMSLSAIGEAFGGRDHGTVIHARQTVENRCSTMASVKSDVDYLYEKISNPRG
jgi:chromosomal replication initiator protein